MTTNVSDSESHASEEEVFEDARDFTMDDESDWELLPSKDTRTPADSHHNDNPRGLELEIRVKRLHTMEKYMTEKTNGPQDLNGEKVVFTKPTLPVVVFFLGLIGIMFIGNKPLQKLSADPDQPVLRGSSHETGKRDQGEGVRDELQPSNSGYSLLEFQNATGTRMRSPIMRELDERTRRQMGHSEVGGDT